VWLIFVLSVIAYSNRQDLAGVAFQCLRVVSVLELLYGSMGGPVIFELHHKSRSVCRGQRQEHDIRKAMTGGQFTDKPVILSRAVVGKSYGTGERIFIVVGQDGHRFRMGPVKTPGNALPIAAQIKRAKRRAFCSLYHNTPNIFILSSTCISGVWFVQTSVSPAILH